MKIENRSALVISALIPESILPKIIFVGAIVTAVAIFYESDPESERHSATDFLKKSVALKFGTFSATNSVNSRAMNSVVLNSVLPGPKIPWMIPCPMGPHGTHVKAIPPWESHVKKVPHGRTDPMWIFSHRDHLPCETTLPSSNQS